MILKKFNKTKIILIIVPIIIFIFLAISIKAGISTNFETWVYNESVEHMSPILNNVIKCITHIGDGVTVMIFCSMLLLYKKTREKIGIPVSIAVITSEVINLVLKQIFARQRPNILQLVNETSYSFPSGHSMINATICTMLGILVIKNIYNKKKKTICLIMCFLLPIIIGFTRIYLGVHFFGDVLGGILLGFAVSVVVYTILKKDNTKFITD